MSLRLITPAAALPVTLDEAKAHLRVDHTSEDGLISDLLQAATQYAEHKTRRSLMPQTWELRLDAWPSGSQIRLLRSPINTEHKAVDIKYTDVDGAEQSIPTDDYEVDAESLPGRVRPVDDWPEADNVMNAVRVIYGTGYEDAAAVPDPIKQAILLIVGHWFANRESVIVGTSAAEVPMGATMLLRSYKTGQVL